MYEPRLEPTAPIHLADRNHVHYPSHHCTVFKKRRLNDGLPAHMITSTRESSGDVYTYTWHTKSMVWVTFFSAPGGQPVKWFRHQIHGAKQEKLQIRRKKGVSINTNGKIPEGQVYAPRLEPTAPIRLADRNNAHYPSRHCTILKIKRRLNDGLSAHMFPSTRVSSEDVYTYTWHSKSMVWLTFFPAPGGRPVKGLKHQIHGAKQEKL